MYEIQIVLWDSESEEPKVIAVGKDALQLAKTFCEEKVIPTALSQGRDTKKKVQKLMEEENWKEILQVYMDCPADMFDPPQAFKIHNPQTGDIFFVSDLR